MGLFDALFGSSKPATTGQQGTSTSLQAMNAYYVIATKVIPERLFRDENHPFTGGRTFIKSFQNSPEPVIFELMLYVAMAYDVGGGVPPNEMKCFANNFRPICGDIGNNLKYLIIEYPKPLPMQVGNGTPVAGPFYSAFVYSEVESSVRYYMLRTKMSERLDVGLMREILSDYTMLTLNYCPSDLESFIAFLKQIELYTKPIRGGVDKDGKGIEDPLFGVIYRYFPDASKPNTMILRDNEGNLRIPAHWRPVVDK